MVQLLTQMSGQLDSLGQEVQASGKRVSALYEQGGKHLAKMRELISDRGPISARSDAFAAELLALMGVIANLQQTSVAPAVKRAAASLSSGFIAPAAGGRTADLADRQTAVVGKVESSIAAQAASLSEAAEKILATPRVEPARFQSMSPAEAVLRYAGDFIPSWAGAISIDLMPAVLVLILCVVHAAIRREGLPAVSASDMTAGELVAALQMAREVEEARRGNADNKLPPVEAEPDAEAAAAPSSRPRKTSRRCRRRGTPNSAAPCRHPPPSRQRFHAWLSDHPDEADAALDFPQRRYRDDRRARSRPRQHERMAAQLRTGRRTGRDKAGYTGAGSSQHGAGDPGAAAAGRRQAPDAVAAARRRAGQADDVRTGRRRQVDGDRHHHAGHFGSFAAEIGKRGDYIKTVVLNSPGGSVTDALAMGRLIREKKFATEVEAGKYCASSCPLVFAGGIERRAGDKAAIGVHQVAALASAAARRAA